MLQRVLGTVCGKPFEETADARIDQNRLIGEVVWLGFVASRQGSLRSAPLTEMPLTYGGYEAEDHAGVTRPSCSRVLTQYPRDTEIRNVRQLSIVSREELDTIARKLGWMRWIQRCWVPLW